MRYLVDVNVLIYAFQESSEHHQRYRDWLEEQVNGADRLLLPEVVATGFLRIVTNPRLFRVVHPEAALAFLVALRASDAVDVPSASESVWTKLAQLCVGDPGIRGNIVPDAYLAAVALTNHATLATRDHGFRRFPGLVVLDPGVQR